MEQQGPLLPPQLPAEFTFIFHNIERLLGPLHLRTICWRKERWAIVCLLPTAHPPSGSSPPQGVSSFMFPGWPLWAASSAATASAFRGHPGTGATDALAPLGVMEGGMSRPSSPQRQATTVVTERSPGCSTEGEEQAAGMWAVGPRRPGRHTNWI